MTRAIVGYSGFVGSNILTFYKFDHFYNSKNFHEAAGLTFDEVYFCGIPAVKWRANKYPQEDADIIESIEAIVKTIKARRFILISTIDVYNDVDRGCDEDYDCDWFINHPYGQHRYLFENFIKRTFDNYNIIRLPALFGKGLKKNVIYDLINNNQLNNIPKNSSFQWYDLNWLKCDIELAITNDVKVCNLFTEPLDTTEILSLFNYDDSIFNDNSHRITYNTKTKYSELFGGGSNAGYIRGKDQVKMSIQKFIEFEKMNRKKLCVSNICIKHLSHFQFARILKLYGINRVQIAPTTLVSDWNKMDELDLSVYTNQDIYVYSFQSICYGLNELNIFDEKTRPILMDHIKKIVDIAENHSLSVLVFGCPKNRKVISDDEIQNKTDFICFFKELGNYCQRNNRVTICIEPNSTVYGCNFLTTISDVARVVKQIDCDNIKMMVDLGNAIMESDNLFLINDFYDIVYNVEVSEPNLKPFICNSYEHQSFKQILDSINYDKNINLEMICNKENAEEELEALTKSLENFINVYNPM
jgi:hypothetical protein